MATALTEKQRVSLEPKAWIALGLFVFTGAGAWYATQARALSAEEKSATNAQELKAQSVELRDHDKRLQRVEDVQEWDRQWKQRIEEKIDAVLSRRRRDER